MTFAHEAAVSAQFGPQAQAYVESPVHAGGPDLAELERIAAALSPAPASALDLGSGGGHVTYTLARHAGAVTAVDISPDMLAAVARTAAERGLSNVTTVQAAAETLPFADETFDFVGCRYSAHHWRGFPAGLAEARRVLKRGRTAVFIDVVSSGVPLLDTHLQAVELLRDTSHVRDHSVGEWHAALAAAGFRHRRGTAWRIRMEFSSWTARMRTPPHLVTAIRAIQDVAAEETRRHFAIEADGSFLLDVALFEVEAA